MWKVGSHTFQEAIINPNFHVLFLASAKSVTCSTKDTKAIFQ